MKKKTFILSLLIAAFSFNITAYAEDYSIKMEIGSSEIVRGSANEVILPVTVTENNGVSSIMAKFLTDNLSLNDISLSESEMIREVGATEDFAAFDIVSVEASSVIWTTKSTLNTTNSGLLLNLVINTENAYPGIYNISFGEKTSATRQPENGNPEHAGVASAGGILTIKGNEQDIADSKLIGDMDYNGQTDSADALTVLESVTSIVQLDITQKVIADGDFDNDVTSNDALEILNYSVGLISDFGNAERVGVYLSDDMSEVVHKSYYKDNEGTVVIPGNTVS